MKRTKWSCLGLTCDIVVYKFCAPTLKHSSKPQYYSKFLAQVYTSSWNFFSVFHKILFISVFLLSNLEDFKCDQNKVIEQRIA